MKKCPICGREYAEGATCANCGVVLIDMESAKPVDVVQEKKDLREKEKQNLREKRDQERQQKIEQRQTKEQAAARQVTLNPRILIIAAVCAVAVIVCVMVVVRMKKANTVQENTVVYEQTQETGDDQDNTDAAVNEATEDELTEDDTAEEVTLNEKDFAQTDLVAYGTETFQFYLPEYWSNLCEVVSGADSVTFYQDRSKAAGYSGELFSVMRVSGEALSDYDNYSILTSDDSYAYIICYPVSATYDTSDEYTVLEYERLLDDVATIQSSFTYTETSSDYIIGDSDSRYLTVADLESLSADELKYARNEIYARHGRKFKDETIQAYFDSKDWYTGTIEPDDFAESMLNEYEKANATLILSYEKEKGYIE